MTHKEENIVNIAMRAGELLKDGRIARDDISGHMGLTQTILSLADQFERENGLVDYNAGGRDYWEEIDAFAEKELVERYGIGITPEKKLAKDLNISPAPHPSLDTQISAASQQTKPFPSSETQIGNKKMSDYNR